MPSQEELAELRARFEAARSFEDDDDWLLSPKIGTGTGTSFSRRSTLTPTAVKKHRPQSLAVKSLANSATKRKTLDLEASKKKWEAIPSFEPPSYQEKAYAPEVVPSYLPDLEVTVDMIWAYGFRLDENGMWVHPDHEEPTQPVVEEEKPPLTPLDILRANIEAKKASSKRNRGKRLG
ncbi:uncharacterized protein RCC_04235 [Ramularia collo-cygni]|uniref:Uncharacterized protein n=1 Tax=Ramularia collo-cygni TaxID=112498 RepID=A0A2D3UR59_9PEZI|nr:uncharacterized protein RCC_04235 [Ramularia collo-cygni]CZT18391.1 uncharacterized protein RCC_04235 [Ramularia collo-cygni]